MMEEFARWLHGSELGQYLLATEQRYFDAAVADVFGYHAVQVGIPSVDFLRENRIPWQCRTGGQGGQVVCDPAALPFGNGSIDLLVLPHVLDFTTQPHQVLREAERVLMPEGRLVLTGFNPLSLWGGRRLLAGRLFAPWNGNFMSQLRIRDWMALLELEPGDTDFMAYAPPFHRAEWLQRCCSVERIGYHWWMPAGGVYGIEAIKRRRGMRLLMPPWKQRRAPVLGVSRNKERQPVSQQGMDIRKHD